MAGHGLTRERNGNWRRGRSVASNGYVLLRVGTGHHLADVRGYAYEHRVVAEETLGRRLRPGEVVHHRDGDKQNNTAENLDVLPSIAHHLREHHPDADTRRPGEPNRTISCACGCGARFRRYDEQGRPRHFISGHNRQPAHRRDGIIRLLAKGPQHRVHLASQLETTTGTVAQALSKLRASGLARPVGDGFWEACDD